MRKQERTMAKMLWLIKQKTHLQQSIRDASRTQHTTKVKLKKAKLYLINYQWHSLVTSICAKNDSTF